MPAAKCHVLNVRYMRMAELRVKAGHICSFATHDESIVRELELLYGVRPDLAKSMREKGRLVRLYLTYGTQWYLYLCHRLAEYPPNVFKAMADMFEPAGVNAGEY